MIYQEALDLVNATPDDTPKSDLWADTTRGLTTARATYSDTGPFIQWITSIDNFCMPHHGPDREVIIDRWLEILPDIPVDESIHAAPAGVVWRNGQRLSTQQMLHSYYARQIDTLKPMRVLEIGAGFGGLARILNKIMPRQYTILDIPSSLFCSYVYLKTHFPRSIHVWAMDAADLDAPADFRYVPAHLWEDLKSHRFDMAVNTCSMGEMLPERRDEYLALIEASCKYFYSHNREDSVLLGPQWEALISVPGGDGQTDPAMPFSRELLVRCAR